MEPASSFSRSDEEDTLTVYGTSAGSRVRVREEADLQGNTLGYLEKGDPIEVLERSAEKMRVGEMTDYRYKVMRLSDQLVGWTYGYYLKGD